MTEYWKDLWTVLLGWEPGSENLAPLPAALFIFFWVFLTGLVLYHVTKTIVPEPLTDYVVEFIKTMTLCGYPAVHAIVFKSVGAVGLYTGIVLALIITSAFLKDGAGNPLNVWVAYFENLIPLRTCLLKNAAQTAAGFSAYHFSMFIMSAELSPLFSEQLVLYSKGVCASHLNVSVTNGFLLEFAGSLFVIWLMYQKVFSLEAVNKIFKLLIIVLIVILGIKFTGMHMHPAKASGLTWGCGSTPKLAHVLVYWVAPLIGTWIAVKVSRIVTINRSKKTSKKKTENGVDTSEKKTKNGVDTCNKDDSGSIEDKGQVRKRKR